MDRAPAEVIVKLQGAGAHQFLKVGVRQAGHRLVDIGEFQIVGGDQPVAIALSESGDVGTAPDERSRLLVPLKISSIRKSTGGGFDHRRVEDAFKAFDFGIENRPASRESSTRIQQASRLQVHSKRLAHTGAPACARQRLIPMVRRNVLLPDMFEPVINVMEPRPFSA